MNDNTLSPLQAYELSDRQKQHVAAMFRAKVIRLHGRLVAGNAAVARLDSGLPRHERAVCREACRVFAETKTDDPALILAAYRQIAMQYGSKRIDPSEKNFRRNLREFFRHYIVNVPIPEEQESKSALHRLLSAAARPGNDEEVAYSIVCPLTGHYIMGVDFMVQPRSDTVIFIYGFINPAARSLGFSKCMIDMVREVGQQRIASWAETRPDFDLAHRHGPSPLVLFEKNDINRMSLTNLLMDTAGIDIDHPPRRDARLVRSGISQNLRDLVWSRHGGRVIDYNYMQSSIEGVVECPPNLRQQVIAMLNGRTLPAADHQAAARILRQCLRGRVPGCTALRLCAFVPPGTQALPAAQIRLANEIFQGISVVKDPGHIGSDIYFQAQADSLAERTRDGMVSLLPTGPSVQTFEAAERRTKRLLAQVSWADLRDGRHRPYREWLRHKASDQDH